MNDFFQDVGGTLVAKYPNSPGFKVNGTSQEAAEAISDEQEVFKLILKIYETGDYTSDEVAEKIGRTPFYTRPRVSQLKTQGKLSKTGLRRANSSGQSANVLCLRQQGGGIRQ